MSDTPRTREILTVLLGMSDNAQFGGLTLHACLLERELTEAKIFAERQQRYITALEEQCDSLALQRAQHIAQ